MKPTLLLCLILLAGCVVRPAPEGRLDPFESKQIHFASNDLKNETAVQQPRVARDDNNYVFITVPIRSETGKELYIDYRVTFKDKNGQVLSQTGWFTKTLSPKVPDQIVVNSMSPLADDFQVDFRWAK